MTVNTSDEIVVGANGTIWVGPTSVAAPTNVATAMGSVDAGWNELGFVDENGAQWTDGKTVIPINVWQSFYAARRVVTARESMVAFVLRQWNKINIPFAFGGGEVTGGGAVAEVEAVTLESYDDEDTFKLTYNAAESVAILIDADETENFNAAGIKAAIEGIAGFSSENPGGVTVSDVGPSGFLVKWNDAQAIASVLSVTSGTGSAVGDVAVLIAGADSAGSEYVYSPPSPEELDERSFTVEWEDGSKKYRLYFPRGMVTDNVVTKLQRTAASDLPITFSALSDGTEDIFKLFTNDPAFA